MNHQTFWSHRFENLLHSAALLGAMALLLAWVGKLFFGSSGILLALVAVAALLTLGRVSPAWVLRMQRARPLSPYQAPDLHRLLAELARRAELPSTPALYLVPSPAANAFAVGNARESAIAVTRGLLASLDRRQLTGVLAHEVSHIRHHDLWVMGLAQLLGNMTRSLSLLGQLVLLLGAPAMLLGGYSLPWAPLLLLLAAPAASGLLQLALSRTREFAADLGAARLTGDPMGLASALSHLDARQGGWWRLLFPVPRRRQASMFDSHPAAAERIERLRSLVDRPEPRRRPESRPPLRWAPPRPAPPRRTTPEPLLVPVRVPSRIPIRIFR